MSCGPAGGGGEGAGERVGDGEGLGVGVGKGIVRGSENSDVLLPASVAVAVTFGPASDAFNDLVIEMTEWP